jgi:hypothetical protein
MGKIIELFSEERRRALCATSGRGEPPPPAYCTPGLNALLGRSSPGVVDSQLGASSLREFSVCQRNQGGPVFHP